MKKLVMTALLFAAVLALPIQADFIQCPGAAPCNGSPNADVINGSNLIDTIAGQSGNDAIFGNDGADLVGGQSGDDISFGGNGSDIVDAGDGNDNVLAGPDDGVYSQAANGEEGNDSIFTFASETTTCLDILGTTGIDTAYLIGFGPYTAHYPFGQTENFNGPILVIDPIGGGNVLIWVSHQGDLGIETIHGLPSPNVTVLGQPETAALNCPPYHPAIDN